MPRTSDEPLRKVTLNLFEKDVVYLQNKYGWGYSDKIRAMVRNVVKAQKKESNDD